MSATNVHSALLSLLLIMLPACARESQSSSTLAPDAFARGWLEAWNSHDVNRILTYYINDAFYEDVPNVANGFAEPWRGRAMIRKGLVGMFDDMSDLGFEFVSAYGAGDRMVVEWNMTGSHWRDFTGRFSVRGVSVLELQDDKIASGQDYYDLYLMLTKLGMVPALNVEQPKTNGDSTTR